MNTSFVPNDTDDPIDILEIVRKAIENEKFNGYFIDSTNEVVVHFCWKDGDAKGRVAVRVNCDNRIGMKRLAGPAPNPSVLEGVIKYLKLGELAHELNNGRTSAHAVEVYYGMSGCRDYLLRINRDPDWGDRPIVARLHLSGSGKLNEGVELWLGDLIPLAIAADIGSGESAPAYIQAVPIYRPSKRWCHGPKIHHELKQDLFL
jgi:hypothetical protein